MNSFLNTYITYRIMLTISVSVASVKRNLSKLKITKKYLRSMLSKTKLNKLIIIY